MTDSSAALSDCAPEPSSVQSSSDALDARTGPLIPTITHRLASPIPSETSPAASTTSHPLATLQPLELPTLPSTAQQNSSPSPQSSHNDHEALSPELEKLIFGPNPQSTRCLCKIVRKKSGLYGSILYELYIEEEDNSRTFLLSAKKRPKTKSGTYIISRKRFDQSATVPTEFANEKYAVVAKIRSNFLGTVFGIYDNGRNPLKSSEKHLDKPFRREFASVLYEPNVLGFKGPRKMTVLLPGMSKDAMRIEIQPTCEAESLAQRFKADDIDDILVMHNKSPQWNEETQSYVLNFGGRVTLASVKNFQIVHDMDLDYIVLQFGRVSGDTFTLDLQYPLSPIQAFGIALSSFDAKLACE